MCGGIGWRHPPECHAVFRFLVEVVETSREEVPNEDLPDDMQLLRGMEVLCPGSCRLVDEALGRSRGHTTVRGRTGDAKTSLLSRLEQSGPTFSYEGVDGTVVSVSPAERSG